MDFLLPPLLPLLTVCLLSCSGTTSGETVRVTVEEGNEAVLPCFIRPEQNIVDKYFNWRKVGQKDNNQEVFEYNAGEYYKIGSSNQDEQFKGRVSHLPDQLQFGDASIRIRDTKLSDSGTYTCDFPRLQPKGQIFTIDLVVDCILKDRSEENIPGACSEPHPTPLTGTKDWSLLQCVVRGASPKPTVEWKDSSGNILPAKQPQVTERGGRYDIILQTTVTKTGDYYCVATQLEICHQIPVKTFVYIPGSSAGLSADVVVTFVVTLVGLLAKGCITQN